VVDENPDPRVQVNLRIPTSLRAAIDSRADQVGRSRNDWLEAAVRWALAQPIKTTISRTTEKI
jgi:predicted HicB family RNase H-like nuclease